jgi:hypothetical protein
LLRPQVKKRQRKVNHLSEDQDTYLTNLYKQRGLTEMPLPSQTVFNADHHSISSPPTPQPEVTSPKPMLKLLFNSASNRTLNRFLALVGGIVSISLAISPYVSLRDSLEVFLGGVGLLYLYTVISAE